jgi:hypothetical protein
MSIWTTIFSTWMEYSYLHGKYFACMARIFLKKIMLLTKVQLTVHKFTAHAHMLT